MPLDVVCVSVKEEPDWDGESVEAARAGLYVGHEVKEELVLGPEVVQPADVAFLLRSQVRDKEIPERQGTPRHPRSTDDVKQEVCEPPMVWIHSPSDFYEFSNSCPRSNKTGKPVTEPKIPSDPQLSQNLQKYRQLYNIRPCTIPLVRIDSLTKNEGIKEKRTEKTRKPKRFFCDFCGKGFAMKLSLQTHIRIHTGEKPYNCQVCRKKFSDLSILIRHRRIHTGEKPHVCDVCEKQFSEKYLLKYHKRLHTGDTPYSCRLCSKTFNHISNLIRHTRRHENKPFLCECNRNFSTQAKLETHLLTHLKKKPYACDICTKCFTSSGHLNRHLNIHFDVKKYDCKVCQVSFTQPSSLKRHVERKICGKR